MTVISRQAGDHPKDFRPAFCDFTRFSEESRRNASDEDGPTPGNRQIQEGEESHVRVSEKSTSLLRIFISLYCY